MTEPAWGNILATVIALMVGANYVARLFVSSGFLSASGQQLMVFKYLPTHFLATMLPSDAKVPNPSHVEQAERQERWKTSPPSLCSVEGLTPVG